MRPQRAVAGGCGMTVDEALRQGIELEDDGRDGEVHRRVIELVFFDDAYDPELRPAATAQMQRWDAVHQRKPRP
jgi:hypothetical protein